MIPALLTHLMDALDEAHKQPKSREMALTITKIEEAIHWYKAAVENKVQGDAAPRT